MRFSRGRTGASRVGRCPWAYRCHTLCKRTRGSCHHCPFEPRRGFFLKVEAALAAFLDRVIVLRAAIGAKHWLIFLPRPGSPGHGEPTPQLGGHKMKNLLRLAGDPTTSLGTVTKWYRKTPEPLTPRKGGHYRPLAREPGTSAIGAAFEGRVRFNLESPWHSP